MSLAQILLPLIGLASVLQAAATVLAVRVAWQTRHRPWLFLALAFLLMTGARLRAILQLMEGANVPLATQLQMAGFALSVSTFALVGVWAVSADIAARQRTEHALRESQRDLREAGRIAHLGSWNMDRGADTFYWSDEMYRIFGVDPATFPNTLDAFVALIHPDDRARVVTTVVEGRRARRPTSIEFRMQRPDGEERILYTEGKMELGTAGEPLRIHGIVQDVTERKGAEEALRESEERYRGLVNHAPLGVIACDRQGRIVAVNERLVEMLGSPSTEATMRFNLLDAPFLVESGVAEIARACLERGESGTHEMSYKSQWGVQLDLRFHFAPLRNGAGDIVGAQSIVEDVGERKRLEADLRAAQKMEAIGTLAGGIAHDFNNLLTVIAGFSEMALQDVSPTQDAGKFLAEVLTATARATDLVDQILTVSRQAESERHPMLLAPLLGEVVRLVRAGLPSTVAIHTDFDWPEAVVVADPTQVHQVVMNLCTNAGHAMRDGGALTVALHQAELDATFCAEHPDLQPGRYARLSVADTGTGMDAETVARIFEPYFTTKAPGEGTGLGLAVTHGIIKNLHGAILIDSHPGRGSTFHVYLPTETDPAAMPTPETAPASASVRGGGEAVLLVDDEPQVLTIGKALLDRHGYQVTTCPSAADALACLRAAEHRFRLVITDKTMPEITGLELAQQVRSEWPHLPILLCTGLTDSTGAAAAKAAGVAEVLQKPYTATALAQAVRRVLDGAIT